MYSIFFIFPFLILNVLGEKFRFDNYTLYKILPQNAEDLILLQNLQDTDSRYDFWNDVSPVTGFVNIMSSPENKKYLESFLHSNNINFEISMTNVQSQIEKESIKTYSRHNLRSMTWDAYYTLPDIYNWMDDLVANYPDNLTKVTGGISHEGREIEGVKLSHGSGRRVIFLEGGIHSREWISPSAVCYILNELLTSTDKETMEAARDFDWYIFPVTNPDGYIWTHDSFRLWRKNRRPVGDQFGVDLNRNWNNNWLLHGASTNPSSDSYAGPGPFSEPETRTLSEFITTIGDKIELYLSFHSYSQMLLIPFGNTTEPLANYYDAVSIGRRAMGALSVRYATEYVTGNIAETIYHATGGSVDWVKEHLQVPLVYCYELRDRGTNGFILPTDQILPNNEETMDSVLEIIYQGKRFGYMSAGENLKGSLLVFILVVIAKMFLN